MTVLYCIQLHNVTCMCFLRHLTAEVTSDAFKAGYTPLNQAE